MFFFKRKSLPSFPFHLLKTDYHSHILPGIDDGSPDLETSVLLLNGLIELGYETFTATPHVMHDIWKNNNASIQSAYQKLQQHLESIGITNNVRAAAEYLLDENFKQLLENKEPLRTIKDNLVLIEISFIQPPIQLKDIIFEMQMQGYQPVFAHPERYHYYFSKKNELQEIRSAGCLFQSNLLSFSGYYGPDVLRSAEWLATMNMVDLLSTDIHHERHLDALRQLKQTKALDLVLDGIIT